MEAFPAWSLSQHTLFPPFPAALGCPESSLQALPPWPPGCRWPPVSAEGASGWAGAGGLSPTSAARAGVMPRHASFGLSQRWGGSGVRPEFGEQGWFDGGQRPKGQKQMGSRETCRRAPPCPCLHSEPQKGQRRAVRPGPRPPPEAQSSDLPGGQETGLWRRPGTEPQPGRFCPRGDVSETCLRPPRRLEETSVVRRWRVSGWMLCGDASSALLVVWTFRSSSLVWEAQKPAEEEFQLLVLAGWQLMGASACAPKGCRFDPQSGCIQEAMHRCFSLFIPLFIKPFFKKSVTVIQHGYNSGPSGAWFSQTGSIGVLGAPGSRAGGLPPGLWQTGQGTCSPLLCSMQSCHPHEPTPGPHREHPEMAGDTIAGWGGERAFHQSGCRAHAATLQMYAGLTLEPHAAVGIGILKGQCSLGVMRAGPGGRGG